MTPPRAATPPPRILVDVWEPPPRTGPNRRPVIIAAAVLVIACATFVTVRAGVFERDTGSAAVSQNVWYPDSTERVGWRRRPPAPVAAPVRQAIRPAPVATGTRTARPSRPPPPGYVAVNSMPWAELSVDGRVVGNTPQLGIRVSAGRHRLVLARDGFAPETTWVTVAPGATVKITGIALTRVAP